jgi:hypothetical protein
MGNENSTLPQHLRDYPHSISAANTYRQCARLYYNRYILGYQEAGEASWLKFGTQMDKLLEIQDNSNLEYALKHIPDLFPDEFEQINVEVLLRLYAKEFGSESLKPVDLNGKPGNQFAFYLNFQGNPVTGMLNMTISGKIDKVTVIDGEIGVMEGKTTGDSVTPSSEYWKRLEMDPQITCYVWGLSKELGRPVNWVIYQVIRRPTDAANPAFKRTYTSQGAICQYTLEEYRARVFDLLKHPPTKPLMARRKLFIPEERKELWVTEHAQTWQEIQERKWKQVSFEEKQLPPEYAWPRNHLGCDKYGGCPFWECCIGKTTIEQSNKFVKRGSR